jgi:proline iminopeptidase
LKSELISSDGFIYDWSFGDVTQAGNTVLVILYGGPGGDYRSLLGLKKPADQYQVVFYNQRGAGLSQRVPADQPFH